MAEDQIVILQRLIEKKTKDLYRSKLELERSNRFLEEVHRTMPGALIVFNRDEKILSASAATGKLLGYEDEELNGETLQALLDAQEGGPHLNPDEWTDENVFRSEVTFRSKDGEAIPVWVSATAGPRVGDESAWYMIIGQDLRERRQLEMQLRHTQKLESVGQLAAGIAHEINTPVQFLRDSIHFLQEAFEDLLSLHAASSEIACNASSDSAAVAKKIADAEEEIDFALIQEEGPEALRRCVDGLSRVSEIVKALKSFAHPGDLAKAPADLNASIRDTLVIAKGEYKYVADLETAFDDELPAVPCCIGDINQVVLNLIVNAAHAVKAKQEQRGDSALGSIRVETRLRDGHAEIAVSDSGLGIPEEIQHRIFEPFFTTKGVGQGTGQGLALANKIVTKHDGEIRFETEAGEGTTFVLALPLAN